MKRTIAAALVALKILTTGAAAQVVTHVETDGSLPGGAATIAPAGMNYVVPEALGSRDGGGANSNLFHSFSRFDIGSGDTVTFSGATLTSNVIARVTGGVASGIDGTLAIDPGLGAPNLYFFNPSGVVFGPDATLNVPADFHASTADFLRFDGGQIVNARAEALPGGLGLAVAAPTAFGFFSASPAAVLLDGADLSGAFADDADVTLMGGDVLLTNGATIDESSMPPMPPPGTDRIYLAAVGAGETPIDAALGPGSTQEGGAVVLSGGTRIVTGPTNSSAEGVFIRGGALVVEESSIRVQDGPTAPPGPFNPHNPAGGVTIEVAGAVSVSGAGAAIDTVAGAPPDASAGTIRIRAGSFTLSDGAVMRSESFNEGDAGVIRITVDGDAVIDDGFIATSVLQGMGMAGPADAGEVAITAANIRITGRGPRFGLGQALPAGIRSENLRDPQAAPPGAPAVSGDAGAITLTARDSVRIDGSELATLSENGDGGDITINAGRLVDFLNSRITAEALSPRLNADGGNISAEAIAVVVDSSALTANARGGPGGNITITGDLVLVSQDSALTASSARSIDGNVTVNSGDSDLSGELATVSAETASADDRVREGCAARGAERGNTFSGETAVGLPAHAGGALILSAAGDAVRADAAQAVQVACAGH